MKLSTRGPGPKWRKSSLASDNPRHKQTNVAPFFFVPFLLLTAQMWRRCQTISRGGVPDSTSAIHPNKRAPLPPLTGLFHLVLSMGKIKNGQEMGDKLLGVPIVGRNQYGYITPAFLESP